MKWYKIWHRSYSAKSSLHLVSKFYLGIHALTAPLCHRWVEGTGDDVVVVASLNEHAMYHYKLGFPRTGVWKEVFNSDAYDEETHTIVGNYGQVQAYADGLHGLPASVSINIPANGFLIFKRK